MDANTERVPRRRRKAPRHAVPTLVEQRERKPIAFGWGADLNHREREALKEKFALFAGIGLAIVLAIILGWGVLQDEVITPHNIAIENNKPVAQVGAQVIRLGYYKRFEQFQANQLSDNLNQLSTEISTLQADPKKNAAQLAQLQQQQSLMQSQQGSLASSSLTTLIEDSVLNQKAASVGVVATPKVKRKVMTDLMHQAGGVRSLQTFIANSGMTHSEIQYLAVSDWLRKQVGNKLAKTVAHYQTEVRASHILIPASKKALAVQLYHQALSGANFAALARKYSTDPGSAKKGGDLGYFTKNQMVAPFANAAFAMKVGQIRLVKSQFGWHIIKVTGRKQAKLTGSQYQQAQSTALAGWLTKEEGLLHVQRFIAPSALPTVPITPVATTSTTNNIVPSTAAPAPIVTAVPQPKTSSNSAPAKPSGKKP